MVKTPPNFGQARRQHGMVWMDTLVGLTLIVTLTVVLIATHTQQRKTAKAMSERREAVRVLEYEAGRVATGEPIEHAEVQREPISEQWVRLCKPLSRGEAELMVFIPAKDADATEGRP